MADKIMDTAQAFLRFIDAAPTPYHAAADVAERLANAGFAALRLDERWSAGVSRAFVRAGDGAIVAFTGDMGRIGDGAVVLAAHTDSPALRVREHSVSWKKGYLRLPTEIYGGPIVPSWLDRDLGIAGRAAIRDGGVRMVRLPQTAIIPNLAIHLNRKINEGFEYNAHDHMAALAAAAAGTADGNAVETLRSWVADAAGVAIDDIAEFELLLFDATAPSFLGSDQSLYAASRIDNLVGCFSSLEAFLRCRSDRVRILVLFNHEEVGSMSAEGAQSGLMRNVLRRLVSVSGGDAEDAEVAAARSVVISNDAAHAIHPSYADKYDPDYAPVLGGGPVLKLNGMYRYATTAAGAAGFAAACSRAGVPMQRLLNRSDLRSGSTVGPITWAQTGIPTIDVGVPLLAMHSIRETAGSADVELTVRALCGFLEGEE